ncbi:Flp pilus assembly complex ATPase component TadA, partial [Candidatus Woesearchaeota archaeon]|nr:Flp pilus assembly complex ATPase component TadA [Candidatus Woesearchaeota archaeon]
IQYELSILFTGGTATGKTSMLGVSSSFFPPNQRIISIEDTRELQLPPTLHWVAMETRLPNPEGKGEVTMLDCVVNTLRMRPDRILVGEIRREKEAQVLFEAMHTGHSVYGTFHANSAEEAVVRLTNPPINLPKILLSSLGLYVVQNRNRRTGRRRTFQVAEILPNGDPNILLQLDIAKDQLKKVSDSKMMYKTLQLLSGLTPADIEKDLAEKRRILQWLVKEKTTNLERIGAIMSEYYQDKQALLARIR